MIWNRDINAARCISIIFHIIGTHKKSMAFPFVDSETAASRSRNPRSAQTVIVNKGAKAAYWAEMKNLMKIDKPVFGLGMREGLAGKVVLGFTSHSDFGPNKWSFVTQKKTRGDKSYKGTRPCKYFLVTFPAFFNSD